MTISTPEGERNARAAYVVACDGGTSGVRERLGVKLKGSTYAERWLVVDAIVKNHNVKGITFTCDPRRPTVELPAVGDRVRWEFMQLPGESEVELKKEAAVRALIKRKAGIDAFEIERKAVYTFHARVADRWRVGRVFLAGDAAHLMPPFAGQGMNGGMKDAVNLSWKLAAALGGQASEDILDTYEIERAPVVTKMVELSRRLGSVIMPTSRVVAAARDTIFACLNLSGRFRAFIGRGGIMPPPAIHRSALTASGRDAVIGLMAPQPRVKSSHGEAQLDSFLGCHQWLALGFEADPASMLSSRDLAILEALGARFVCLNGLGPAKSQRTLALHCDDLPFIAWAEKHGVRGVLVRPDRFIAARLDKSADLAVLNVARLDYHLDAAGKHTLFFRGNLQNIYNPTEPFLPGTPPETVVTDHSKGFAVGYTTVLGASRVNNFRYGFTRESYGVIGNDNQPANTFIGLDQGLTYSQSFQLPVHNLVDDFSWTKGTHTFQFGGNIGIARDPRSSNLHSNSFTLGTSSWMSPTGIADTGTPLDPASHGYPGVDLSFKSGYDRPMIGLLGIASDFVGQYNYAKTGSQLAPGAPVTRNYALNWYELYLQDSWRVKPNLTVTYGVRWSLFPPPYETNGLQVASTFSLGKQFATNVANMKQGLGYTSEPSITFEPGGPANHGPGFYQLSKTDFAPRVSFAYSLRPTSSLGKKIFGDNDRTVIRGGFSEVYDRPGFQLINTLDQNAPGEFAYTLQNTCCQLNIDDVAHLPRVTTPSLNVIPQNSAIGSFLLPAPTWSVQQPIPTNSEANIWAMDDTLKTPRSYAVDFSIARELPNHYSLQLSYVGRFGGRLLTQRDLNQPLDIVDPQSKIDYYAAATALSKLGRQGYTTSQISDSLVGPTAAYWHDVLPGLTNGATTYTSACGGAITPGSAGLIQAVYDVYYNPACAYVGNEIVGLADIDLYGYFGDNQNGTLHFNGPAGFFNGAGKYLNNQAISAYAWSSVGNSNFNALQASLRKQFSNGVQFDLNYTYSKSIDVTSTAARVGFALVGYQNIGLVGSRLENAFDPNSQRSVSDFDLTHQINANWIADLPFGKGKRFAANASPMANGFIGGWQLTGVARWTSGYPFSVDVGQNWPTDWQYTGLAQLAGPKPKTGVFRQSNGSVTLFADPATVQSEFIIPFPGSGASRNVLRGQGYAGLDLGLSKRWRFLESQSVQFTWQVFNVLNLVRFNAQGVGSAVTSIEQSPPQFGTYSSLLTQPRVMQFALRYEF